MQEHDPEHVLREFAIALDFSPVFPTELPPTHIDWTAPTRKACATYAEQSNLSQKVSMLDAHHTLLTGPHRAVITQPTRI